MKLVDVSNPMEVAASAHENQLRVLKGELMNAQEVENRWLWLVLISIVTIGALYFQSTLTRRQTWEAAGICAIAAIAFYQPLVRAKKKSYKIALRIEAHQRALKRMNGTEVPEDEWREWDERSVGTEYERDGHLYENDLLLLGKGSLFEKLDTTRTKAGAERLADYLLDGAGLESARRRQDAVIELRPDLELREDIAVLGKYSFQSCDAEKIREWANQEPLSVSLLLPVFMFFSSLALVALVVCGIAHVLTWSQALLWIVPLLLVQLALGRSLSPKVQPRVETMRALFGGLIVLRDGLELMHRQRCKCALLQELVARVGADAAKKVARLERWVKLNLPTDDPTVQGVLLWLGISTQLALAGERWRTAHCKELLDWVDAWAEFDALNAIAAYAFEHPLDCFPELVDGPARFEARELGHPLLRYDHCVRNDVMLNEETDLYVISGSNMSGKSTLLKAMGTNAVLAQMGAPVRASKARMSVFRVCASISILDSLLEGRSKFLAEVERMQAAIRLTDGGQPVLFLIDEILSGTNSHDRRVASAAVIQALLRGNAVGALSTHDLALTEIAELPGVRGVNVHMQGENPDEPLEFDYRLKPGKLTQTNALAIIKMVGIPIEQATN